MLIILGIESSCDDTSAAVCIDGKICSNSIANQAIHQNYGGVVPELASRAHQQNIIPTVQQAIDNAKIRKNDVNAIAFTRGPGLLGSLLVGTCFAKAFALANRIPLIEVNHMQAHILAHFIDDPKPPFPFICLTVSGGHTQIVLVKDYFDLEIIGQTLDDAAGEAFDKTAQLLGLGYPGGLALSLLAEKGKSHFDLPRPLIHTKDLNFSFSGLKTAVLHLIRAQENLTDEIKADVAFAFQEAITDVLAKKCLHALNQTNLKQLVVSGGVGANKQLRQKLKTELTQKNYEVFFPRLEFCTDNGAMIAFAGAMRLETSLKRDLGFSVKPRWQLA